MRDASLFYPNSWQVFYKTILKWHIWKETDTIYLCSLAKNNRVNLNTWTDLLEGFVTLQSVAITGLMCEMFPPIGGLSHCRRAAIAFLPILVSQCQLCGMCDEHWAAAPYLKVQPEVTSSVSSISQTSFHLLCCTTGCCCIGKARDVFLWVLWRAVKKLYEKFLCLSTHLFLHESPPSASAHQTDTETAQQLGEHQENIVLFNYKYFFFIF